MSLYSTWGCLKEKAGSGVKCAVCRADCPFYMGQSEDEVNLLVEELKRLSIEMEQNNKVKPFVLFIK